MLLLAPGANRKEHSQLFCLSTLWIILWDGSRMLPHTSVQQNRAEFDPIWSTEMTRADFVPAMSSHNMYAMLLLCYCAYTPLFVMGLWQHSCSSTSFPKVPLLKVHLSNVISAFRLLGQSKHSEGEENNLTEQHKFDQSHITITISTSDETLTVCAITEQLLSATHDLFPWWYYLNFWPFKFHFSQNHCCIFLKDSAWNFSIDLEEICIQNTMNSQCRRPAQGPNHLMQHLFGTKVVHRGLFTDFLC